MRTEFAVPQEFMPASPPISQSPTLRILHVEDSALDAELLCVRLKKSGRQFEYFRVETRLQFDEALARCGWSLILADYNLPTFTGLTAMEIASRCCPDIPFIIVSGVLGEEVAIDTLKNGATDYVLKERLDRLVPAIDRAMAECSERRQRREAQAALLKSESALRAALLEAERANAAKDQFLAVLSHELRTPLAPILTTSQILSFDSSLNEEQRNHITVIRRNAELEARLIDDLLDLTRIVRGKIELVEQSVDLHQLIDSVVEICRDDLVAKQHKLVRQFHSGNAFVRGDAARLQQILWNLIKNAVKFTPNGGMLQIKSDLLSDNQLRVTVQDNGIGIDPAALPRIFAPFEQADTQTTRRFGGLGLGLSIAKLLAEKHDGSLVATSDGVNQGATFTLILPAIAHVALPTPAVPPLPARAASMSILLVEDHADTARAMSRLLRLLGHHVRLATHVAEAEAEIAVHPFDLLISDIGLPDGSGLDVVGHWKAAHPDLPAVALTGFGMDHDVERCRNAGFNEHLIKPVHFDRMQAVLRSLSGVATGSRAI